MLADADPPSWSAIPSNVHVYVADVDTAYARALEAGAESVQAPVRKDDDDRRGGVGDVGGAGVEPIVGRPDDEPLHRSPSLSNDEDRGRILRAEIEALYRRESRRVLATLIRLLGDFELAEEAMQEAFVVALERWRQEGVPESPRAWLVATARFKGIDRIRQRARFEVSMPDVEASPTRCPRVPSFQHASRASCAPSTSSSTKATSPRRARS